MRCRLCRHGRLEITYLAHRFVSRFARRSASVILLEPDMEREPSTYIFRNLVGYAAGSVALRKHQRNAAVASGDRSSGTCSATPFGLGIVIDRAMQNVWIRQLFSNSAPPSSRSSNSNDSFFFTDHEVISSWVRSGGRKWRKSMIEFREASLKASGTYKLGSLRK